MKKDIFNGNIKQEHVGTALFSIIFGAIVFLACAIFFLCMALFYDKFEDNARTVMYAVSAVGFVCSVAYPVATFICVRTYPKHKGLAHRLLKDYVFVQKDDE